MEYLEKIRILSERIQETQKHIQTEEATKQAFVIPFISAFGYDVHDPRELIPEFTADVGTKKGEKVDYAVIKDGQPIMLIECKMPGIPLDDKANLDQLIRYFGVTKSRIAVLTNGILYRFFTDLDAPNLMDQKPFLAFSLLDIQDDAVAELERFRKDRFDINQIVSAAAELKYTKAIKSFLIEQGKSPSDKFLQFLASHVCNEKPTARVMLQIRDATKRAMGQLSSGQLSERSKTFATINNYQNEPQRTVQTNAPISTPPSAQFADQSIQALIPSLEGQIAVSKQKRKQVRTVRKWDKDTFILDLTKNKGQEAAAIANRIIDWMRNKADLIGFGNGRDTGSIKFCVMNNDKPISVFLIYSDGSVSTYFGSIIGANRFKDREKRIELMKKANELDGVNIHEDEIGGYPTFPIAALQNNDELQKFFSVFTWVAEEIRRG